MILFWVAYSVQASAIARAAALVMTFWFRVTSIAEASAAKDTASTAASESRLGRMRMGFLLDPVKRTVEIRPT